MAATTVSLLGYYLPLEPKVTADLSSSPSLFLPMTAVTGFFLSSLLSLLNFIVKSYLLLVFYLSPPNPFYISCNHLNYFQSFIISLFSFSVICCYFFVSPWRNLVVVCCCVTLFFIRCCYFILWILIPRHWERNERLKYFQKEGYDNRIKLK